jgi:hypothetical protein
MPLPTILQYASARVGLAMSGWNKEIYHHGNGNHL